MPVKVREAIRRLRQEGWVQTSQEGSHRQFEHPTRPGKVTVPGHLNDDTAPAVWASIRRQAGLK